MTREKTPIFSPGQFPTDPESFTRLAMETFHRQALFNPVYKRYLDLLKVDPLAVTAIDRIPFLPIEFFKTEKVVTGEEAVSRVFESSGTTGMLTSKHFITREDIYLDSLETGFRRVFGDPAKWCFLALLPSYLERRNSSLVYMMNHLIQLSGHPLGGFYLDNLKDLSDNLEKLEKSGQKSMLLGVTFALLKLAELSPMELKNTILVETGGMKGRGEELTRQELHRILTDAFHIKSVYSEYGMTELLSQGWSTGDGIYTPPPWMQIRIRDPYNPFRYLLSGKTGGIDVIDLANQNSCSFVQTQDLGRAWANGSFEVLGRFDNSELRGCNLLY